MKFYYKLFSFILIFTLISTRVPGQQYKMSLSLEDVIQTAQEQSLAAIVAKHNFIVSYWQYRTYKAKLLPNLVLNGSLANYNRSLIPLQDYNTGEIDYKENNTLTNSLNLAIEQNLPFSGGSLSIISAISRLDQFSNKNITYNTNPIQIYYTQPINAYNSFKWEKKIEPKKLELAKKTYLKELQNIILESATYFFNLLLVQQKESIALASKENTQNLYNIAKERFKLGSITKDELLQLELKLLNDEILIFDNERLRIISMQRLRNYLGYNDKVELTLIPPQDVKNLFIDINKVVELVNRNSPDVIENEVSSLISQQEVARAKSQAGIKAQFFAKFGVNQASSSFAQAYKELLDQEVLGFSISLPIVDWGLGKGGIKVAKSKAKVAEASIEQNNNILKEDIMYRVMLFNGQWYQCNVSKKASEVSNERYNSTKNRFINGAVGVMELNNAQKEMDEARLRHLQDISNYWLYYYDIQKLTQYNFFTEKDIIVDVNQLVED